jgi:putative ATP-binding cassette transporter
LGEQQRLAFARLLLTQPRYAFLDEATSALDVTNEALLYRHLRQAGTTFVSVGHRPSLVEYHDQVLELQGGGGWRLASVREFKAVASA